jgi:hypothetical protein
MIALNRIRTAGAIKAQYRGADKRERDKELMLAERDFLKDPSKKIVFKSIFWKKAKVQLKKESSGKCAYCEANSEVVAHGDVEHYRPKSVYWWLAYTYDNYLYACQICNQIYKSDNFPISGTLFPAPAITGTMSNAEIDALAGQISPDPIDIAINYSLQTYLNAHRAEEAFLLNPYFDDPANYIAFEADDVTEEVTVVPINAAANLHVKAMEDFYGINRIELKNFRYQIFRIFRILKKAHNDSTEPGFKREIKREIDQMVTNKFLFSGMNKYFDGRL